MTITSLELTVAQKVKRGAELLDEHQIDWAGQIDTGRLRLISPASCVLGQLFGRYSDGLELLDLDDEEGGTAASHGFTLNYVDPPAEWAALEAAWREEISART